jgi:hypothetical protein
MTRELSVSLCVFVRQDATSLDCCKSSCSVKQAGTKVVETYHHVVCAALDFAATGSLAR